MSYPVSAVPGRTRPPQRVPFEIGLVHRYQDILIGLATAGRVSTTACVMNVPNMRRAQDGAVLCAEHPCPVLNLATTAKAGDLTLG